MAVRSAAGNTAYRGGNPVLGPWDKRAGVALQWLPHAWPHATPKAFVFPHVALPTLA